MVFRGIDLLITNSGKNWSFQDCIKKTGLAKMKTGIKPIIVDDLFWVSGLTAVIFLYWLIVNLRILSVFIN